MQREEKKDIAKKEESKVNSENLEKPKVSNSPDLQPSNSKKCVSFDLNRTQNIPPSPTKFKPIIFNGTFPIDLPIKYDPESNELDRNYAEEEDDDYYYREDDGEEDYENPDDEDEESYSDNEASLAIHNILANKKIPINYRKMCTDVENSITQFENLLNERRKSIYLRTFEIDAPIEHKKSV